MDLDDRRAREMKILSDILALALDQQPGVSTSALEAIKQRARAEGVTGGALKEVFIRAQSGMPAGRDDGAALARARARIEELQSQVGAAEQMRRQEAALTALWLRRARLLALASGLLAGAALTVIVVWGLWG